MFFDYALWCVVFGGVLFVWYCGCVFVCVRSVCVRVCVFVWLCGLVFVSVCFVFVRVCVSCVCVWLCVIVWLCVCVCV